MTLLRRSFAALSGAFLLQLTLLGSGTLCARNHAAMPPGSASAMGDMPGMSPPATGAQESVSSSDSDDPANPASCGQPAGRDGCRIPSAPGQCAPMTACGVTAAPGVPLIASAETQATPLVVSAPNRIRSGPTTAPELPPPRA